MDSLACRGNDENGFYESRSAYSCENGLRKLLNLYEDLALPLWGKARLHCLNTVLRTLNAIISRWYLPEMWSRWRRVANAENKDVGVKNF